jgi:hypothetical protein
MERRHRKPAAAPEVDGLVNMLHVVKSRARVLAPKRTGIDSFSGQASSNGAPINQRVRELPQAMLRSHRPCLIAHCRQGQYLHAPLPEPASSVPCAEHFTPMNYPAVMPALQQPIEIQEAAQDLVPDNIAYRRSRWSAEGRSDLPATAIPDCNQITQPRFHLSQCRAQSDTLHFPPPSLFNSAASPAMRPDLLQVLGSRPMRSPCARTKQKEPCNYFGTFLEKHFGNEMLRYFGMLAIVPFVVSNVHFGGMLPIQ